jgi:hypothetical protein
MHTVPHGRCKGDRRAESEGYPKTSGTVRVRVSCNGRISPSSGQNASYPEGRRLIEVDGDGEVSGGGVQSKSCTEKDEVTNSTYGILMNICRDMLQTIHHGPDMDSGKEP